MLPFLIKARQEKNKLAGCIFLHRERVSALLRALSIAAASFTPALRRNQDTATSGERLLEFKIPLLFQMCLLSEDALDRLLWFGIGTPGK